MNCPRCDGLMCVFDLQDWISSGGQDSIQAYRCILCGEIMDSVIIGHREKSLKGPMRPKRTRARHRVPLATI